MGLKPEKNSPKNSKIPFWNPPMSDLVLKGQKLDL
jgi:hypothetical protein